MPLIENVSTVDKIIEGKTKIVYSIENNEEEYIIVSKDRITAGNNARGDDLIGKAQISTSTFTKIFQFLTSCGIKNHFVRKNSPTSIIARKCHMIPIEFVTRRIATGSFLKRNQGVPEGYKFCPLKLEYFYKDDANNDPQWSYEQIVSAQLGPQERKLTSTDLDILSKSTITIFEVLEKMWSSLDCQLVDMKIEFGIDCKTGELLLADVIDSDSWRLWPSGDKRLMLDKQFYRDLKTVTQESLNTVKRNFEYVADKLNVIDVPKQKGLAVILMGSPSDEMHCRDIAKSCQSFGVQCQMRVTSAHKGPEETLKILSQYECMENPVVLIAVAGRSNGLGPVLAGNTCLPVINCPPIKSDWGTQDIWSSLRLPSGLGCSTVISPDTAAIMAANILSMNDHVVWGKLRVKQLNTWVNLKRADIQLS